MDHELERRWYLHIEGGTRVEVCDDEDGLDLCKITCFEGLDRTASFYLPHDTVATLGQALIEYARHKGS